MLTEATLKAFSNMSPITPGPLAAPSYWVRACPCSMPILIFPTGCGYLRCSVRSVLEHMGLKKISRGIGLAPRSKQERVRRLDGP